MIPPVWPNILLGVLSIYAVYRFVRWVKPWEPTPAEKARARGDLVYDEEAGEFIDYTEEQ